MKRGIVLFLLMLISLLSFAQEPQKTNLAVMDLGITGISNSDGKIINDSLVLAFVRLKKFDIIERSIRDEILKEKGFTLYQTCNDTNCLLEVGKYLSVQKVIGGNISKLGNIWNVNVFFVDIKTGKVEETILKTYTGKIDRVLENISPIVNQIVKANVESASHPEIKPQNLVIENSTMERCSQVDPPLSDSEKNTADINNGVNSQSEIGPQRNVEKERVRKKVVASELLSKKKKMTKLKLPILTYSALVATVSLTCISYINYTGAEDIYYNKYLDATTTEDAIKYREETETKNKNALIYSYAAVGAGTLFLSSLFLRKKVYPELLEKNSIVPEINFTPVCNGSLLPLIEIERTQKNPRSDRKLVGLGVDITWRF